RVDATPAISGGPTVDIPGNWVIETVGFTPQSTSQLVISHNSISVTGRDGETYGREDRFIRVVTRVSGSADQLMNSVTHNFIRKSSGDAIQLWHSHTGGSTGTKVNWSNGSAKSDGLNVVA